MSDNRFAQRVPSLLRAAAWGLTAIVWLAPVLSAYEVPERAQQIGDLVRRGDHERALAAATRWLVEAEAGLDRRAAAWAEEQRGNALFGLFLFPDARDAFDHARRLMREAGDLYGEALALKDSGIARKYTGQFEDAILCLQKAEVIFRDLGASDESASTIENLGMAYETLGDPQEALALYRQSLQIWMDLASALGIQGTLIRMGLLYLDAGNAQQAEDCFVRALDLTDDDQINRAWTLSGLSVAREQQGDIEGAIDAIRQSLDLNFRWHRLPAAATDLVALAGLRSEQDPEGARRDLQEAIRIFESHAGQLAWNGYGCVARAHLRSGNLDAAVAWYDRAIATVEGVRRDLNDEERRSGLISNQQATYLGAIDALMTRYELSHAAGDDDRAFELLERARARTMADALAAARSGTEVPPASAVPLRLPQVRSMLDSQTALVAYAITTESVYAFVVTRQGLRAGRIGIDPEELTERVRNYIELLGAAGDSGWQAVGSRLYRDLIAPLRTWLPSRIRRLIVLPDGALNSLPFEALITGGAAGSSDGPSFLIEDYTVSYLPSVTVWSELRRTPQSTKWPTVMLVVANPTLKAPGRSGSESVRAVLAEDPALLVPIPYAEVEARRAAKYAGNGATVLVGGEAREARVKSIMSNGARVVHFATHGFIDEHRGSRAGLLLASGPGEDGLLVADEIYARRVPSELVVMSACQTARGRLLDGEGAQSLARAFIYAGARSVVASLWRVDDLQSARLMECFYRRITEGMTPARALCSAKLSLLHSTPGVQPRDWAAFIIVGDADRTIALIGLPRWQRHGWWLAMGGLLLSAILLHPWRSRPKGD
ncbi:MAG: CHAT domain-containing protein [Acidobacteriota bacterium]